MADETERIEKALEGNGLALSAVAEVLQKMDARFSKADEDEEDNGDEEGDEDEDGGWFGGDGDDEGALEHDGHRRRPEPLLQPGRAASCPIKSPWPIRRAYLA